MKTLPRTGISPAQISWQGDGTPLSSQFDDVYFSRHSGLQETRHVFLESNRLDERLAALQNSASNSLCVGETGFGTGLNFLCTWQLRNQVSPSCHLHFFSAEKYPLTREDMVTALAVWPELAPLSARLIEHYPVLTPGWHRISFNHDRVDLSLFVGDVHDAVANLDTPVDAWFLDGFSPAKNPDMWTDKLFRYMARASHKGTTLGTFTAAGSVREGLRKAGFEVERIKGFARKRHMTRGRFTGQHPGEIDQADLDSLPENPTPWFARPTYSFKNKRAIIIGGGLAGTSAAHSLARRGWAVSLYEQHPRLASEASGNSQGVLYNKVSAEPSLKSDFYTAGYLYSLQQLRELFPVQATGPTNWQPCGVLQLGYSDQEQLRQRDLLSNNPQPEELVYPVLAEQASRLAGIDLPTGGLFFPGGGWANPRALCEKYVDLPNINVQTGVQVARLDFDQGKWRLLDSEDGVIDNAEVVILANANDARKFNQTGFLPVKPIRGQTTRVPYSGNNNLTTVICGNAYITPGLDGHYQMGATFNLNSRETGCTEADHATNLKRISEMTPSLASSLGLKTLDIRRLSGRVGFRASSPDYLPLVGPVPDIQAFVRDYASLRKDAHLPQHKKGVYLPGLYVTTGHGSKGLTTCPLAGEILAACLCNEVYPVAKRLADAVNPARFVIRDLKRNRI